MKILISGLALSGSFVTAEWNYQLAGLCNGHTNCKYLDPPLTYDEVTVCLKEPNCAFAAVGSSPDDSGAFLPIDKCATHSNKMQLLDTGDFFVALPVTPHNITTMGDLTPNFAEDVSAKCELQLDFLPKAVSNCEKPTENNAPFATLKIKKGTIIAPKDVWKNREGKTVLVTSTNWDECKDGLSNITYPKALLVSFSLSSGAPSSIAVGGLLAIVATIFWWS